MLFEADALVVAVTKTGLRVNGELKHLRPKALKILRHLVRNRGKFRTKAEIIRAVWERAATKGREKEVEAYVHEIREAMGVCASLLMAQDRFGYLFDPKFPSPPEASPDAICRSGIVFLPNARRVFVRGEEIFLSVPVFKVLEYLMSNPGVCSREKLIDYAWDDNRTELGCLYRAIQQLREKVEFAPRDPKIVVVVASRGWLGSEGYQLL